MLRKYINPLIIISGGLSVVAAAFFIAMIISFVRDPILTQPAEQLENGGIVYITESRTFQIFLEDNAPPTLNSHSFTFINTENQNRIYSRTTNRTSTYAIGAVTINNVSVRGRFGRLVALVDLEEGSYIVEFSPWEGSGVFVWGFNLLGAIFRFIVQVFISGGVLVALSATFMFLIVKRRDYK